MEYVKVITLNGFISRVRTVVYPGRGKTCGWTVNQYGRRELTLPATREEYISYWRSYPYWYPSCDGNGIRIRKETISGADTTTGAKWETTITRYTPNRNQRKHGITMIG